MTLEEAIKHTRNVAENRTDLCEECRAEHKQLADWLEQLVKLTEENERLRAENVDCRLGFTLLEDAFQRLEKINEQTKADTVREMQSEINKTLSALCKGDVSEIRRMIDQIAKEMLEGNDG